MNELTKEDLEINQFCTGGLAEHLNGMELEEMKTFWDTICLSRFIVVLIPLEGSELDVITIIGKLDDEIRPADLIQRDSGNWKMDYSSDRFNLKSNGAENIEGWVFEMKDFRRMYPERYEQ